MKRGGPLARKTRLVGKTPLKSGGFLRRGAFIPKTAIKPTRPTVTTEERDARRTVKARAQGRCEGCGTFGPTDYSHRVNEGQGGPWAASNAMALCRIPCHHWLHHNLLSARERGWYLRSYEDFRAIPVRHAWLGLVLLHDDGTITRFEEKAA